MNFHVKNLSDVLILAVVSLLFILSCIPASESLQCFQCSASNNDECSDKLRDCPSGQAYDRCMTRIIKNPKDGKRIRKECALAPCHLPDVVPHVNFANFMTDCETSMKQDCAFCCTGDACNKDSAPSSVRLSFALQGLMLFAIVCFMLIVQH